MCKKINFCPLKKLFLIKNPLKLTTTSNIKIKIKKINNKIMCLLNINDKVSCLLFLL